MVDQNYNLPQVRRQSALNGQIKNGLFGNLNTEPGIFIKENHPLSIVQLETREPPAKEFLTVIKNLFELFFSNITVITFKFLFCSHLKAKIRQFSFSSLTMLSRPIRP